MSAVVHDISRAAEVEIVPVELGRAAGSRARLGLIGLSSGMTCETELHQLLPEDTMVLTSRVRNSNEINLSSLAAMESGMKQAAQAILPEGHLDVMVYSCTSGTVAMGEQTVIDRIREVRPGIAVTTPFTAAVAGMRALGIERVAMLTPYTAELTAAMRHEIEVRGVEVVRAVAFGLALDSEMCRVEPRTTMEAALAADCDEADGVFISCTALRTVAIVEETERRLGKPLVTSNQALAWHALRLAGYGDPVPGYGRLMREAHR